MTGTFNHPPAFVIMQYLIDQGLGTARSAGGSWPIHYGDEPDTPDNCITVYDSEGRTQGRAMTSGEVQELNGIQVRVRCAPTQIVEGYKKCHNIVRNFDSSVNRTYVPIGSDTYLIQAISRTSDVISLGTESPSSRRRIYTATALVSMTLMPGTGSY